MTHEDVLQQLYIECHDDLESLLFARLRCRDTAADISHEAFLRLHSSDDLGTVANLRAYLFRIAINLVNDHFRASLVRGTVPEDAEERLAHMEDRRAAETVAIAQQQLDLLIAALSELPPLSQRIFYLNRFEGLKHREIAEHLGVSVRTVEDHMRRSLLHCDKRVGRS